MKNTFKFTVAALCAMLAASCAKEIVNDNSIDTVPVRLSVSSEASRTSLSDGTKVFWSKTDQVGVVCYDSSTDKWKTAASSGPFSIENASTYIPSTSATFTGNIVAGGTPKYVVYPYWEGKSAMDSKEGAPAAVSLNLPWEQTGVIGGIPENSVPMLGAIAGDGSVAMKNACALLKFEVTDPDATGIAFKTRAPGSANSIAGKAFIKTEDYEISRFASDLETVSHSIKVDISGPGVYYFPVYATTLPGGFNMEVLKGNDKRVRRTTSAFTFERDAIYNLGDDTNSNFVDETGNVDGSIQKKIIFSDDTTAYWDLYPAINTTSTSRVGPFAYDCDFWLYYQSSNTSAPNVKGGFRFGGAIGDYLEIAGIKGYTLSFLNLVPGDTVNSTIQIEDTSGNVVTGGESKKLTKNASNQFNLKNTVDGANYRIVLEQAGRNGFKSITIKYKKVTE